MRAKLQKLPPVYTESRPESVVAFGGGHGLAATLRALKHFTRDLTAVVTVADDGGSSGRLRSEMGVIPPGDLRMALSALCDDSEWGITWMDAIQHRFCTSGPLDGHTLGNLLIVTMWELLGDTVAGLDWVAKLLGCHGRVLPMCAEPMQIEAELLVDGIKQHIVGQSKIAKAGGELSHLRLVPALPSVRTETLEAIARAEGLVLGPGSWYTSVLPHLLVPQLRDAIVQSQARKVLVLNLQSHTQETSGMNFADHLAAIRRYAPQLSFDCVIADRSLVDDEQQLAGEAQKLGAYLLLADVHDPRRRYVHDPLRLAAALRDALT